MAEVGALLLGFAFLLLVGCSGDTGSQPSGSQDSEVSQSEQTGSERSASRESESTVAGSQPSGSQDSETTHEVTQHGGSQASEGGDSTHDGVLQGKSIENVPNYSDSFLPKIDGITYDFLDYSGELKDEDLGPLFAEVNRQRTGSTTQDQAASDEVPVYAIKGYDTSFRIAILTDYGPIPYEVLSNPRAEEGSDILDIGGKVRGIGIAHMLGPEAGGLSVGGIEDSEKAERVVQSLMDAPIKPTDPDYYGTEDLDQYHVSFVLRDGTFVSFEYRMDTGTLSKVPHGGLDIPASGIVTPQAFREAIEEGVEKPYQRLIELEKAERRSCSDTRMSQEIRRIDSEGGPAGSHDVVYTTNDVDPSGPWGGVLRGTGEKDKLLGEGGEDEIYGLGGDDAVEGGACDDKIYGGPGNDNMAGDEPPSYYESEVKSGKDVLYGEDGDDTLSPDKDGQRDELYCGKGYDTAWVGSAAADKIDYVDDSCEVKDEFAPAIP
jgi:Ca2+-binding RTX toxin-like protein